MHHCHQCTGSSYILFYSFKWHNSLFWINQSTFHLLFFFTSQQGQVCRDSLPWRVSIMVEITLLLPPYFIGRRPDTFPITLKFLSIRYCENSIQNHTCGYLYPLSCECSLQESTMMVDTSDMLMFIDQYFVSNFFHFQSVLCVSMFMVNSRIIAL